MRLGAALLVITLVGVPPIASGQTSVAEGVDAFARGDYGRAAELLEPNLAGWPPGRRPQQ